MDEKKERGFLGEVLIFSVFIGLSLGAIYLTGNWPAFIRLLAKVEQEALVFWNMFWENIQSVIDALGNAQR